MNATRKSPPSRQVFLLTIGAMIGAAGFAVLVVILHLLPSTYNPLSHYVSDYAHDSYGYLMQMAFALLGVGVLSLVGAYYLGIPRSARPQAAMILLIVFGLSRLTVALFSDDLEFPPSTLHGSIHAVAGLVGFSSVCTAGEPFS